MENEKVIKMVGTKKEAEKENKIKELIGMTGQVAAMLGPDVIGDDQALMMFQRYTVSLSDEQNTVTKLMGKKDIIKKLIAERCEASARVFTYTVEERNTMQEGVGRFIKRTCNITYFGGANGLDRDTMIDAFRTSEKETKEELLEQINRFMEVVNDISNMLTIRVALKDPEFNATCFTFAALEKPSTVSEEEFNHKIEQELIARINNAISKDEIRTIFQIVFGIPIN